MKNLHENFEDIDKRSNSAHQELAKNQNPTRGISSIHQQRARGGQKKEFKFRETKSVVKLKISYQLPER